MCRKMARDDLPSWVTLLPLRAHRTHASQGVRTIMAHDKSLVPDHIASIKPYVPGKPIEELERELGITNSIKLASNENPLGPSPRAMEAIRAHVQDVHFYPDGAAYRLKEACADYVGAKFEEVAIGNGSNELLTLIARTFCMPGDHAVISDYSFIAYRIIMQAEGMTWTSTPMKGDFQIDVDAMLDAIEPGRTRLLFIANPNNPTGTYIPREDLERILTTTPEDVVVVIDEAYHEYVQASDYVSAVELRHLRENLIITRTFSKAFGLGGMRVGFAVAPAHLIDYINRVREPFNCNLLGQVAATAALQDMAFISESVKVNEEGRAVVERGLASLGEGVRHTPSQTNFLLIHTGRPAGPLYDSMLRKGVIVRPMAGYGLAESLRVTLGTAAQCERFLAAFGDALSR